MCLILLQLTFTVLNGILNGISREYISERHIYPAKKSQWDIDESSYKNASSITKSTGEMFNIEFLYKKYDRGRIFLAFSTILIFYLNILICKSYIYMRKEMFGNSQLFTPAYKLYLFLSLGLEQQMCIQGRLMQL